MSVPWLDALIGTCDDLKGKHYDENDQKDLLSMINDKSFIEKVADAVISKLDGQTNPEPELTNPEPEPTNPEPELTNPEPEPTNPEPGSETNVD